MSCLKTYYCSPNSYHKITVIQLRIWRNVKHYFPCILRLKHFYIIVWIIFKLLFRRKSFFSAIGIQLMECYISHQNVYWAHNNTRNIKWCKYHRMWWRASEPNALMAISIFDQVYLRTSSNIFTNESMAVASDIQTSHEIQHHYITILCRNK